MVKTALKEIIITVLICAVILVILSIVFYNYNPMSKVIPNKVAYTTPEEIREQIQTDTTSNILEEGYNLTYSVENADLELYKKSSRYVAGRAHPFQSAESIAGDTITDATVRGDVPEEQATSSTSGQQSSGQQSSGQQTSQPSSPSSVRTSETTQRPTTNVIEDNTTIKRK